MQNFHANIIEFIKNIIHSQNFLLKFRKSDNDFTRNRKLPFHLLILFLLNMIRASLQNELDNFYKLINNSDIDISYITKSAFTKARKKLKHQAFIELNNEMIQFYYSNTRTLTWKGFYLKGVDGTMFILPKSKELVQHFGEIEMTSGKTLVEANVSQIYDCLNGVTTSSLICSTEIGERRMLENQLNSLNHNDFLILDRGYPAFWLFALLVSRELNFCTRIETEKWKVVKEFYESDDKDKLVVLNPSSRAKRNCKEKGISVEPLALRLVKIELDSGETEILVTTLVDRRKYKYVIFKDLYHHRWPVEEDFKVMKHRIEIENFSGKTVESIYQDFYAKVFTKNLTAILKKGAQEQVNEKCKKRKLRYKVNFTNALSKMKNTIVILFIRDNMEVLLGKLLELITKEIEAVRPDRKFERGPKKLNKRFHLAYKPIA